jgi:hypothetical protein
MTALIFSDHSVRAILAGAKTQTRRIIKPQPPETTGLYWNTQKNRWYVELDDTLTGIPVPPRRFHVGDEIWVREAWATDRAEDHFREIDWLDPEGAVFYFATADWRRGNAKELDHPGRRRTPFYMPRWACRLTLKVTAIRAEQLQRITEEDARAEGLPLVTFSGGSSTGLDLLGRPSGVACGGAISAREQFIDGWNRLNQRRGYGWKHNPWVWVITFRRIP